MKRFLLIGIFLFCLTSCKRQVDVTFQNAEVTQIYAIEDVTNELKVIELEYPIENERELFCIYTIYQNHLPLGYSSPASPNLELVTSSLLDGCVQYDVNNFIFLSDLKQFHKALLLTGKQFGYKEIHIFFNEKQLI